MATVAAAENPFERLWGVYQCSRRLLATVNIASLNPLLYIQPESAPICEDDQESNKVAGATMLTCANHDESQGDGSTVCFCS